MGLPRVPYFKTSQKNLLGEESGLTFHSTFSQLLNKLEGNKVHVNSKTRWVSARRQVEFNMCFEILLQGTQSLTPPAPELFFPLAELPEGRQWGLAAPDAWWRVRQRRRLPCAGCPCLPLCQTHCQAAAELGTSWGTSTASQTLTAWEK